MLVSKSLIFVHNPRTGGFSVREYLRKAFPDTWYPQADTSMSEKERLWIMHQGLGVAHQYAAKLELDPWSIPTIACIRNPYSITLSGYLYLAQRWQDQNQELEATFPEYLANLVEKMPPEKLEQIANFPYGPFTNYLMVGSNKPGNLTIAKTESLADDLEAFVEKQTGSKPAIKLDHLNRTEHDHFSTYYSSREEELVYRMYKNTFQSGLYKRFEGLGPRYD